MMGVFNTLIGIVIGWFAHLHYGEQITDAIARLTGSL